jgi:hypothetical protein
MIFNEVVARKNVFTNKKRDKWRATGFWNTALLYVFRNVVRGAGASVLPTAEIYAYINLFSRLRFCYKSYFRDFLVCVHECSPDIILWPCMWMWPFLKWKYFIRYLKIVQFYFSNGIRFAKRLDNNYTDILSKNYRKCNERWLKDYVKAFWVSYTLIYLLREKIKKRYAFCSRF